MDRHATRATPCESDERLSLAHGSLDVSSDPDGYARIHRHGPTVVTIGKFDGIHRGHRALLSRTMSEARRRGCQAGVVTFDRHPREALLGLPHRYLTCLEQRRALLADAGMDFMLLLRATKALFATEPEAFVRGLVAALNCRVIIVGPNFRFGRMAAGDVTLLSHIAGTLGVEVATVALRESGGGVVSSTRIRAELGAGRVELAADLLGRPFSVRGMVRDTGRRGACIDVAPDAAVPSAGVYLARIASDPSSTPGAHEVVEVKEASGQQPCIRIPHGAATGLAGGTPVTVVFERRQRARRTTCLRSRIRAPTPTWFRTGWSQRGSRRRHRCSRPSSATAR
jgi:riboflavin kinase/FMN adenylyltransferase